MLPSLRRKGYFELEVKTESKIETIENSVNGRVKEEIERQVKAGLLREFTRQESVKVSSRLVQLGHLTQTQIDHIMETYTSNDWVARRECRSSFISSLRAISGRLSNAFCDINEGKVKIDKSTRANSYPIHDSSILW